MLFFLIVAHVRPIKKDTPAKSKIQSEIYHYFTDERK